MTSEKLIVKRFRAELKRLGLTIEQVSYSSGIAKGTLDNIVTGRTKSMKDMHIQALWLAYPALRFEYILTGRESEVRLVQLAKKENMKY